MLVVERRLAAFTRFLGDALGGRGLLTRSSLNGFRVILHTVELRAALKVAERLRRAVEGWRWAGVEGEPEHSITISVGVATGGHASVDSNTDAQARRLHSELEADADRALRYAKEYGGNLVWTRKSSG